jgi:hypothetical protein
MFDNFDAFEILLKAGADPNIPDEDDTIIADEV